ncbi:MAG: tRNA pseudouridine(55) synthase TruB [Actinomycetota bacterium]|jgi:tRNA pseudouridine55 synthase|nr:tRNA pseudouridine(55) synthase TruB [Euzebyaceae bacterium]MBA3622463.1 tRNA pseudouridine(55) synthase TruB [Euzebyales bacterium]MDQ3453558.1 tRNA pseudouridine(55) synthase TruB [Actinomycetota bacterium]
MGTQRGLDGVIVVDKPAGMTSHDVVAAVRRAVGGSRRGPAATKVGHAGTLDPDATGVLVVCLGRATRLVPYVQASAKTYDARLRLGATTDTLDASGQVLEQRDASAVDEATLCEVLKAFVGDIRQIPPMVSAVKVGGERLYVKARRGEQVTRDARAVTIHDIVLEDFQPGAQAEAAFLVRCSAGTYIRTLAADVGERLGVGAHLVALRRLGSGRFSLDDAVDLDKVAELASAGRLAEALLTPAEAMADYPTVVVDESQARLISHGRPLSATGEAGPVAVLDTQRRLIAVVRDADGVARPTVVLAPAGAGE